MQQPGGTGAGDAWPTMTGQQRTGTSRSSGVHADAGRQLDQRIEEVARRLLGEPNRALSTRTQLRFGRNGSVAVELAGNRRGQWYDHEQKVGGSMVDLIRQQTGLGRDEAVELDRVRARAC